MATTKGKTNMPTKHSAASVPAVTNQDPNKPAYLAALEQRPGKKNDDNFDSTDVTIPRIKLLQGLSKECETYDSAKPGIYWHTGLDLALGAEFRFIAVSRRKKYLLVAPLEDGQGILARADDFVHWSPPHGSFDVKIKGRKTPVTWKLAPTVAESGLDKWGTYNPDDDTSPSAATLFYEYLVLLPDHLDFGPVVLLLTRSQIRKVKKGLNDKIQLHASAGRPMQALVFLAKVIKEEGKEGQYFNWQFISDGFVKDEALFKRARELKDILKTYRVQDEDSAARGEEETSTKANPEDY